MAYKKIHVLIGIEGGGVNGVQGGVSGGSGVGGSGSRRRIWRIEARQQISHSLGLVVHRYIIILYPHFIYNNSFLSADESKELNFKILRSELLRERSLAMGGGTEI